MIETAFNGNPAYLIDDQPEWSGGVEVTASMPAMYERSLTGKETRRQTGDTLRLALKFTATISGYEPLTNLRNSLQALNVQPVLCPFWPGWFPAGSLPMVTAPWYVLMDETAAPSIQPASALGAGFARDAFPLMTGRLSTLPDPKLLRDNLASVEYEFAENDASTLTFPEFDAPAGIAAASGVRPLFPFAANWNTEPVSAGAEMDITYEQIGQTRPLASVYYTQRNRRRIQQTFTLTNYDGLNLLSFYVSLGGQSKAFWLPASLSEATLTANVAATDTQVTVDNPAALGTNTFIVLNDNFNRVPLAVSLVSGNNWELAAAVGTAFAAVSTRLESLVLARFDALKFTLSFETPLLARCLLKFKELPWETAAVAGETIGTTMGPLPTTAMLYVFTLTTPGANTLYYFTNYERNLTDGDGNVYRTAPMENEPIAEAASLERQNVNLKARNFAGNPLALLVPFQLEWPLLVAIYEADVAGNAAGNLRCYFSGEVSDVSLEGPVMTANCASLNWMFDRSAARRLIQPSDNWNLFEPASGITPADWKWNCVVVSYDAPSATLIVGTITSSNPTATPAHFFAAGYLQLTHVGAPVQYRMIADSTAAVAGQITLYLTEALTATPSVGDAVAMYPGYDGSAAMCINTFNNYNNFGGFPFVPTGNPFVMKIVQPTGTGKK